MFRKSEEKKERVCPWWLCFTFDNPLRKLFHNPERLFEGFIKKNDLILDVGPGMGYFTIPMAEMVGERGKVVALDIQKTMFPWLERRARRKKVAEKIITHLYDGTKFNLNEKFDFVLAFWMVHEIKNKELFIEELKKVIKKETRLFIAEPKMHVTEEKFNGSIELFQKAGFKVVDHPEVKFSRAAILSL